MIGNDNVQECIDLNASGTLCASSTMTKACFKDKPIDSRVDFDSNIE